MLELRFLGEFKVLRDGQSLPLPPSKKTRALLAYLSLRKGRFRREQLCELLWEIPDDPRGSLRWSLSKLRRLIDDEGRQRVIADRTFVNVDTDAVSIDVKELNALIADRSGAVSVEVLAAAEKKFRGNFLEGVEFSGFHDFHTWCVAQREASLRDRSALLSELIRRCEAAPEQALPYARALVGLSPYDETARATLIRLLHRAGQMGEAGEQFQLGMHMLKEAGVVPTGTLLAAHREPQHEGRHDAAVAAKMPAAPVIRVHRNAGAHDLIGRDEEAAELENTLADVVANQHCVALLLRGAPGIGKTSLLNVLLAAARQQDMFLLHAAAFEADAIRPFALWIDALRALGSDVYERVFAATDIAHRDRLFSGLSDLVGEEAATRPVVILFDDMHWCDDSSAAALHYIARMNRSRPVLMVMAARSGELRDHAALQQAMRGLRRDGLLKELVVAPMATPDLSRLILQHAPDADSVDLSSACGGNPLLAIELARAESAGSAAASLDELLRARLARFTTSGAEVVRWASVLVPPVDVPTLIEVTGFDSVEVSEAFDVAEEQGIFVASARGLQFAHDLIRKAVYSDLSPLRRQVMHRRVAEALVKGSAKNLAQASWLAHHASRSGDPALAARALVAAGRLCLRFFANEDAISQARTGLKIAQQLDEANRVALEIELHEVLFSAAPLEDREEAAELYTSLAERALDHGDLSRARLGYHMAATVRWSQGNWDEARKQSLQSARVVHGDDSKTHIIAIAETAKCLVMLERDLSQADAMLMEADARATRKRFAHAAIAAGTGMLRFHEDRLDEAEELLQQSRTMYKSAGDRVNEFLVSEYLVIIAFQRAQYEEALARANRLVKLGEKIRAGSERPFAAALHGLCSYALGDDGQALDIALVALRSADAKYRMAYVLTRAALLDCQRGRPESAVARATEALGYAKILDRATEMLLAHAVLARGFAGVSASDAAEHAQAVERLQLAAATWAGPTAAQLTAVQ